MSDPRETLEDQLPVLEDCNWIEVAEAIRAVLEENEQLGEALKQDHAALFTAEARIEAALALLPECPRSAMNALYGDTDAINDGKALRGENDAD